MFEFLVFGGWIFWTIVSVVSLILIGLVEADRPFISTLVLGGFIALFYKSFAALVSPAVLVWAVPTYFAIGAIWSVWRWRCHVVEYVKGHPEDWAAERASFRGDDDYIPLSIQASYNKTRITNWIMFWPWSASWLILGDTLTALFNALANIYNSITESAVKNARQDARRTTKN
jgi:hypothetical protein